MATAVGIPEKRNVLHARGSWSARDDRWPSAVWLALLWLGMLLGFGLDMHRFTHESPAAPRVIYVHAAVFSVWMLLLTVQVLLVLGNRIAWHKRLGWISAAWVGLMLILGPWAAMASQAATINLPAAFRPQFLALNLVDIATFAVLVTWGIALRKNPAAHKRMMILATVALSDPGFARLALHVVGHPHTPVQFFVIVFYGDVLIVAAMTAWDWWKGRLMRSFVFGAAFLLAGEVWAAAVYFWAPWHNLTAQWVQAWMRHGG